ncbi:MAG TPA: hypothetical protein VNE61_02845 [Ktedonobacteraceae bacterium]|nr:hypothetical protein [Ktedonobacteraceae bacterium]
MNSTGGPHILLFERDQQLATLLMSELQLAGFECHTARTAVEVFDTIARYPVRMVLVNLAQAAAGRREFWVALDTQRRGRGVQVFTIHCTNIAGYGPASDDADDRPQSVLADMEVDGMMGIMNLVNAIRARLIVSHTGSMSRLAMNGDGANSAQVTTPVSSVRPASPNSPRRLTPLPPSMSVDTSDSRAAGPLPTDKIRAMIYPGQRPWNPTPAQDVNGSNQLTARSDDSTSVLSSIPKPAFPETAAEIRREPAFPNEPGLAQLSRMAQGQQSLSLEEQALPLLEELARGQRNGANGLTQNSQHAAPADVQPLGALPLRASPIEDLPSGRMPAIGPSDRSGYASQVTTTTRQEEPPTLLSIARPSSALPTGASPEIEEDDPRRQPGAYAPNTQARAAILNEQLRREQQRHENEPGTQAARTAPVASPAPAASNSGAEIERIEDNAILLDIMQSLPPMPVALTPPPQAQVLNGRATRTLGSVLLEGHLVPQERLDVAQSIQRMLRGVDMNYQLGEILLMFKLLTPDQLLAASLVSYGMLTTTQIRALGRVRQELHAIGLEYDLENLLILFRILTSEQLREVRASWSG